MPTQTIELPFPAGGIQRRTSNRAAGNTSPPTAAWASNVRTEDAIDRRLRGGSRPGLTKFVDDVIGATIADIASINISSAADGAREVLFALVDSSVKTVEGGVAATQVAYLTDESGNILTDESGNRIIVSSGDAPSTGFLVTGQQHVFAVGTSAIVKMDPKTGRTDNLIASAGTVPTNCTFGAVYRDRLCLSGEDNAIYMSRVGDYGDFDYGAHFEDQNRAVPFQLSLGADVGPLPTALIPHKDAFLLAASKRSLWVVRGDPTTGELRRVSENTGIISSRAWCKVEDQVYLLAEDGLYRVSTDGSDMRPISTYIPEELRNVDTSTVNVSMGWEHDRRAVHVYLRTTSGSDTHFIYEIMAEAWWPVRFQNDHSPLAVAQHDGKLLLAGGDGHIRYIGGDDDDGASISSHALLGPVKLGSLDHYGLVNYLHGIVAEDSGTVTWRLVLGETADKAADNGKAAIELSQSGGDFSIYVAASGTWSAGRSATSRPRRRSVWAVLWLSSTSKWAYESVTLQTSSAGRWRG